LFFRIVTQEIFSELYEMKAKPPIFSDTKTESEAEMEEGQGLAADPYTCARKYAADGDVDV
jgi:hypothetical protein